MKTTNVKNANNSIQSTDAKEFREYFELCLNSFYSFEKQTSIFKNSLETTVADSSMIVGMLKQVFEKYQHTTKTVGLLLGFERVSNEWKMFNEGGAYEM